MGAYRALDSCLSALRCLPCGLRFVGSTSRPAYLAERLRTMTLPALILHGDGDPRPLRAAQVANLLLHGRLVVLPDVGHFPCRVRSLFG